MGARVGPGPTGDMTNLDKRVRVNIYGEEYSIRANGNDEYIREVAAYLDRQMRTIADKLSNKSPSRVAVLAALNIADELFAERNKEDQLSSVEKRANQIISLLDEKIPGLAD